MAFYVEDERDTTHTLQWDNEYDTFSKSCWRTCDNTSRYVESEYDEAEEFFEDFGDYHECDVATYDETESQDYEEFEMNAELLQAHDFAYS